MEKSFWSLWHGTKDGGKKDPPKWVGLRDGDSEGFSVVLKSGD